MRGYRYPWLATAGLQAAGVAWLALLPDLRARGGRAAPSLGERLRGVRIACFSSARAPRHGLVMVLAGTSFGTLLYLAPALAQRARIERCQIGALFAVATLSGGLVAALLARAPRWGAYAAGLAGFSSMASRHFFLLAAGVALIKGAQAAVLPRFRKETGLLFDRFNEATAMSMVTTATSVGFAVLGPFFGGLSDAWGLDVLVYVCVALFALALLIHAFDARRKVAG